MIIVMIIFICIFGNFVWCVFDWMVEVCFVQVCCYVNGYFLFLDDVIFVFYGYDCVQFECEGLSIIVF